MAKFEVGKVYRGYCAAGDGFDIKAVCSRKTKQFITFDIGIHGKKQARIRIDDLGNEYFFKNYCAIYAKDAIED